MDRSEYIQEILRVRKILTWFPEYNHKPADHIADQEDGVPMPPRVKGSMGGRIIDLPDFDSGLPADNDFISVVGRRKTDRVFSEGGLTLAQISYLLWCAQGMREINENSFRSSRNVASGGGRHPFEMYMIVQHAEDIEPGLYHYLPLTDQIEYLGTGEDISDMIVTASGGQKWTAKASVLFILSAVPYRTEWRYGVYSHPLIMMDAGHVSQNMYLAAASLGLGCCTLARIGIGEIGDMFGLDGEEETAIMAFPVGTLK